MSEPTECDCDPGDEVITQDDYICEKCYGRIQICCTCSMIIDGCACGHCDEGTSFMENDG
jgi:hypothetical protein